MKILYTSLLALSLIALLLVTSARADENAYSKIIKERDAVLSQILTERESRFSTGLVDDEAVLAARLALFSFRRDTATTTAEKIKQQDLIVAVWQKKLTVIKSRASAGLGGREDILLATDSLLQSQQVLEELKLDPKKG